MDKPAETAEAKPLTRPWKVFIVHIPHTDPGWHDLPPRIMEKHAGFLDELVRLCEQTRGLPPEQRFVYTYEHSWSFDYYERHRTKEQFERLMECCRSGQLEVGALYAGVHSDFCGHEELARLVYYAADLRKRFNLRIEAAVFNDVSEGYTMGMPQVLAKSGLRGIIMGHGGRMTLKNLKPNLPRIFRWQTPDGSWVLAAWTPGQWTYMAQFAGFKGVQTLQQFDDLGAAYPYDAIFRQGGGGDNSGPNDSMRQKVLMFREQFPGVDFRMARVDDFIGYMTSKYGKAIPAFQGDNPHAWADGTISLAMETGMHRRSQAGAIAAEKLAAMDAVCGGSMPYPADQIADIYRNLYFYSDHTWGLDVPSTPGMDVNAPECADWGVNWQAKKDYAVQAAKLVEDVRNPALASLCARIPSEGTSIAVWNVSSWPRTDIVRLALDARLPAAFALVDARSGREVPCQKETPEEGVPCAVFAAEDVPPFGYAMFRVEDRRPAAGLQNNGASAAVMENSFYRVKLDETSGCIASIIDKELGRELVDPAAPYGMNQYVHAWVDKDYIGSGHGEMGKAGFAHGEGVRFVPGLAGPVRIERGPVFTALETVAELAEGPAPASVRRRVVLYNNLRFIEVQNVVAKKASSRKEQIFFCFPFAVPGKAAARVELPYAVLRWERDILPGCWRGYMTAQHWVDVSGEDMGVTWAPMEAPVVSLGGFHANQWDQNWHDTYVPENGHIYSYVMSNVWNCNYPLWQGGTTPFTYRFASHAGRCDPAAAARFGWGRAAPLMARIVGRQSCDWPAGQRPGISVSEENVMVTAFKRAEDGRGFVMRIYETAGRERTTARIAVPFVKAVSAKLSSLTEEDIENLPLESSAFTVRLKANELVTVRLL